MKRFLLILITLSWLSFFPDQARACQCVEYGVPVCAAYWRSDAVFVGLVQDITPVVKKSDREIPTVVLHFIVEQPFRGVSGNRVEVVTMSGTMCDIKFDRGKRYLIYAVLDSDSKQLFTGFCMRTTELEHAGDDLEYIRAVMHQDVTESIAGRIEQSGSQELAGRKITVQGGGKMLETMTDDRGDFSVSLPGPGKYTVRAFVPFAASAMSLQPDEIPRVVATDTETTIEYEVEVGRSRCNYRQLRIYEDDLHATAEVSGSVLTASSLPGGPGWVYLVNAADPDDSRSSQLEENGSFRFEGVAVGEYYLVVNPRNEPPGESDAPYSRTYYPSAAEAGAATKIVVTEGAKLENLVLRLNRPLKARLVTGKVVWDDKRPAKSIRIKLFNGERYHQQFELDQKGRFSFKVYGDFKYGIEAESYNPTQCRSDRLLISKDKTLGLKLMLRPVE